MFDLSVTQEAVVLIESKDRAGWNQGGNIVVRHICMSDIF